MEKERKCSVSREGRFLPRGQQPARTGRWLMALVLLIWDGVLLYMIGKNLIEPVCGAAFVAVISIDLGYKI